MAGYDPQRRRPRSTPRADDPAAVDELLDGAGSKSVVEDRVAAAGAVAASVTAPVTARPPLRAVPSDFVARPEPAERPEVVTVEERTPVLGSAPVSTRRASRAPLWAGMAVLVAVLVLVLRRWMGSSHTR